jgi:hypothetical protein
MTQMIVEPCTMQLRSACHTVWLYFLSWCNHHSKLLCLQVLFPAVDLHPGLPARKECGAPGHQTGEHTVQGEPCQLLLMIACVLHPCMHLVHLTHNRELVRALGGRARWRAHSLRHVSPVLQCARARGKNKSRTTPAAHSHSLLLSSQFLAEQSTWSLNGCAAAVILQAMQPDGGKQLPPYGSWLLKVADFGLSRTGEAAGTEVVSQLAMAGALHCHVFNVTIAVQASGCWVVISSHRLQLSVKEKMVACSNTSYDCGS